jgi:ADP-ribose pyrophosphatase YjhB (NUDIX family)
MVTDKTFASGRRLKSMDDLTIELTQIAEQLRALSNNGLQYTDDPYQIERFHKILSLAARTLALAERRPQAEIERIFFDDLTLKTPFAVVDTAVFDDQGRMLLIQRADDRLWAMPGGACDVGEAPATGAAREVWEETGYIVEIDRLIGVFDSRLCSQRTGRHLYHFLFAGAPAGGEARTSIETLDVAWFSQKDIPWEALSPGHKARIRHALSWRADPTIPSFFDREGWRPPEEKQ